MNDYPTAGGEFVAIPVQQPQIGPLGTPVRATRAGITPHVDVVAVPPGDKAVAVPAKATAVTATEWQPLLISMARGVAEAFVLAAVAVFAMLQTVPDADARAILIVAGGVFFTKLAAAYGIGTVDQRTATKEG